MTNTAQPSSTAEPHKYGVLLVFAAGVLWSTVGLGIRLIEDAVVWQILFYRSISLSVFLYIVIRLRSGENAFVQISRVGFPAVIAGLLGWLVLKEPVRKATWIAIVVALAGIAIMVADKSGGAALKGNFAALGSALGFAVFTVALRWGKSTEMLSSVFLSGLFGIVVTFFICQFLGLSIVLSVRDGGIAMGMGVFQVGAGLILYTIGSRSLPAAELTLLSLAEVLLGPMWVWLFLGETATIYTLIGGAVLLAAIAGNTISGKRRRPPPIAGP